MEAISKKATISPTELLEEGHEYAKMPPVVDGAPVLTPAPPPRVLPPHLCEQGPCRNLMVFRHTIDAEKPKEEAEVEVRGQKQKVLTGTVAVRWGDGSPVTIPVATVRYCFPHPGVEMPLIEETVVECSRWDPLDPSELSAVERRRELYQIRSRSSASSGPQGDERDVIEPVQGAKLRR